jgi:hypothetical protein
MPASRRRAGALVAAALAAVLPARSASGVSMQAVRLAGEASPLGWAYSSFAEGTMDASGALVFVGSSTATFQKPGSSILRRIGSGTVLTDGRHVSGVGPPDLTGDGCVIARASFMEGGEAVLRRCNTTITVLLESGTTAPNGGTIRAFDPAVYESGTDAVSVSATLADGTAVVLRQAGGQLHEIARSGVPAPGGGTYAAFRLLGATPAGATGYHATVSDGPDGIFSATIGGIKTIVVGGEATPAGGSFGTIGGGTLHPSGAWAFRATLRDGRSSVFAADTSGPTPLLRAVAISGDPLPLDGGTIDSFPSSIDPSINATGTVVFRALVNGVDGTPSGVFSVAPDGTITTLATVREKVPDIGTLTRLRDPVVADDGSVVVSATVSGVGPGLFVWRDGNLAALAQLGDPTDADTGDARFRFSAPSVTDAAENGAFLGQRDAIFRTAGSGDDAIAYVGGATPLGGAIASLGEPCVDGRGTIFFGAELQNALFNEALLTATAAGLETLASPDLRLLGGGGIRELFPTSVDQLARPTAADRGVLFTASLQGAKASAAIFRVRKGRHFQAVAKVGGHAGSQRLANLGTPSAGPGSRIAFLADLGRNVRHTGVVAGKPGQLAVVGVEGTSTRTRIGQSFAVLGPPSAGRRGAAFHATTSQDFLEGIFIGAGSKVGAVAASGDTTTRGDRLRTFGDPVVVADDVWFLARVAGSVAAQGLYRVRVASIPARDDPPLPVEPILLPGDPAPAPLGGVIVRIDTIRVGPSGIVTLVVEVGGGSAPTAILALDPTLP